MKMRRNVKLSLCILTFCWIGSPFLFAADEPKGWGVSPIALDKFVPSDFQERKKWISDRFDQRTKDIMAALEILRNSRDQTRDGQLAMTVAFLGKINAVQAVPDLLTIIDFKFLDWGDPTQAPRDSVVIKALADIGKTSSVKAMESLATDKSSIRGPMYLRVIYLVEGPEVGKFMLQNAANVEKDPDKKARLQKAVELFQKADKVVL